MRRAGQTSCENLQGVFHSRGKSCWRPGQSATVAGRGARTRCRVALSGAIAMPFTKDLKEKRKRDASDNVGGNPDKKAHAVSARTPARPERDSMAYALTSWAYHPVMAAADLQAIDREIALFDAVDELDTLKLTLRARAVGTPAARERKEDAGRGGQGAPGAAAPSPRDDHPLAATAGSTATRLRRCDPHALSRVERTALGADEIYERATAGIARKSAGLQRPRPCGLHIAWRHALQFSG